LKRKIYLYPLSSIDKKKGVYNPYIDDLIKSLSEYFIIVNRQKPSSNGILDLIKYLPGTDYVFFNWIEKLPENRFGFLQTVMLYLLFPLFRLMNIRVVWTMHNKLSHSEQPEMLTKAIFRLMLKKSDTILTHSREGIRFGNEMVPGSGGKITYFAHPVKDRRGDRSNEKLYDVLIWGTISPYKGIDHFLEYLHNNDLQNRYRILIAGKAVSKEYAGRLSMYENEFIRIRNEFISDSDLIGLINASHLVLFTYSKASILSSGVLMDSLGYGAKVVGPHVGAFADLAEEGIVKTFPGFEGLEDAIQSSLEASGLNENNQKLNGFLSANSWDKFAEKIFHLLEKV
jgi:beta-1,4-mannosyltransferase